MTEPEIVAVIGGGATIVVAAIGVFTSRKKEQKPEPKGNDVTMSPVVNVSPVITVSNAPLPVVLPVRDSPVPVEPAPKELKRIESTHKQIMEAIERALPYHRDAIKESYIGKRVRWNLVLSSVHHNTDSITIYGHLRENRQCGVWCKGAQREGDAFISAQEGWTFVVDGEIEMVFEFSCHLLDSTFSDVRPPGDPPPQQPKHVGPVWLP